VLFCDSATEQQTTICGFGIRRKLQGRIWILALSATHTLRGQIWIHSAEEGDGTYRSVALMLCHVSIQLINDVLLVFLLLL